MPDFSTMSHEAIGAYIGANLTTLGPGLGLKIVDRGRTKKAPIHEIASNRLPHSMYLFINAVLNQQKVVDGRRTLVQYDFYKEAYYGSKPVFSSPQAKTDDNYADKKAAWIDKTLRETGRVPPNKQLDAVQRNALLKQVYKQKQEQLYGMRSVHLDVPGWLPAVAIPNAPNAQQRLYRDYIATFTELPGNIQDKSGAKADDLAPYVEYTAGNKDASGEFSEPRWRVVYDWVNQFFYLTWHYQSGCFTLPNGTPVESPWVRIAHIPGSQGLEGPATPAVNPATSFKERMLSSRGIERADWG